MLHLYANISEPNLYSSMIESFATLIYFVYTLKLMLLVSTSALLIAFRIHIWRKHDIATECNRFNVCNVDDASNTS